MTAFTADSTVLTQTGAPEIYRVNADELRRSLPFSCSADIWSLGCILSEAGVWVINGFSSSDGLEGYRARRRSAHPQDFSASDCFHDGQKVLEAVKDEHSKVLGEKRQSDIVTQSVINMVENMLARIASSRWSASNCRRTADEFLEAARQDLDAEFTRNSLGASGSVSRRRPRRSRDVRTSMSQSQSYAHDRQWDSFPMPSLEGELTRSPLNMSLDGSINRLNLGDAHLDRRSTDNEILHEATPLPSRSRRTTASPQHSQQHSRQTSGADTHASVPRSPVREPRNSTQRTPPTRDSTAETTPSRLVRRDTVQAPASLSYARAMKWYEEMKKGNKTAELPNHHFTKELGRRDHVSHLAGDRSVFY